VTHYTTNLPDNAYLINPLKKIGTAPIAHGARRHHSINGRFDTKSQGRIDLLWPLNASPYITNLPRNAYLIHPLKNRGRTNRTRRTAASLNQRPF
jgi:hypothetical protein